MIAYRQACLSYNNDDNITKERSGSHSYLFWEYIRIFKLIKTNILFLENVASRLYDKTKSSLTDNNS